MAENRPRSLIQMATGSGKTFTVVSFVYRLIKQAKAKRVLFLVDRNNLGRRAFKEFDEYLTPDDGRKFTELYNVQHLQSNVLDSVSKVHITSIQRLYSMLSGEPEFDAANEEKSLFEMGTALDSQPPKEIRHNPNQAIEYYDFIMVDECHEMFSGREIVPKTLIFAKDDSHAEDIVRIAREEFGKRDDFCQKIAYRSTGKKPQDLISDFRNSYHPRIAVIVDIFLFLISPDSTRSKVCKPEIEHAAKIDKFSERRDWGYS